MSRDASLSHIIESLRCEPSDVRSRIVDEGIGLSVCFLSGRLAHDRDLEAFGSSNWHRCIRASGLDQPSADAAHSRQFEARPMRKTRISSARFLDHCRN